MNDSDRRRIKAEALRDAAEGFRRTAADGTDPELNSMLAELLEKRATRIAAGEDDYTEADPTDG